MRQQHVEAPKNRPNRAFFKTLDGSVKKTTAFVKKIKSSLTEQQRQSVLTDFEKTNLSRFLSEVATTLAEAGLTKNVDLQRHSPWRQKCTSATQTLQKSLQTSSQAASRSQSPMTKTP